MNLLLTVCLTIQHVYETSIHTDELMEVRSPNSESRVQSGSNLGELETSSDR